jgi:hypothetical protein
MNKVWIISILIVSLTLLLILKTHEKRALVPYFKAEKSLQLGHFREAKKLVTPQELTLLELWESMLTGRVAPLDRWLRQEYRTLALAHVFTPSGFHLSALLWPVMFFLKRRRHKIGLLSLIGLALCFLPGQSALKRMTLVKTAQQFVGMKSGLILAFLIDIFWGSFSDSPLGFTYSFLFLGIIYSGMKGISIIVWFFIAQILIAFIQGSLISPLLLFISPVINFTLTLILPLLFLMAWPLWNWQLATGLWLLSLLQDLVSFCYKIVMNFPLLEINIIFVLLIYCLIFRRGKEALLISVLMTTDLNSDLAKIRLSGSYEWQPQGRIIKIVGDKIYRKDGICKRELIRGMWWENCSPRKRSSRKNRLKKLSYPS